MESAVLLGGTEISWGPGGGDTEMKEHVLRAKKPHDI